MENSNLNFKEVLTYVYDKKYIFVTVSIITGILAFVFSSPPFVSPQYKAVATFYPASSTAISKSLTNKGISDKTDLLAFGDELQVDHLLQTLYSDEVTSKIKDKYNLMKHYKIENTKYPKTRFAAKFKSNVNYVRTKYSSIKVEVFDRDPVLATNIANDIVNIMDSVRTNIKKKRAKEIFEIVETNYLEKQKFLDKITDSLQSIGQQGIFSFEDQSAAMTKAYAEALAKGNPIAINDLEEKMNKLGFYGPKQQYLSNQLIYEIEELSLLRAKYKQAKVDMDEDITNIFIINKATIPEKKARPVRSMIVLLSVFLAFIITFITLKLISGVKKEKK